VSLAILLPAVTSLIALVFAVALADQWRERRHAFQAIWALGMLFFGIAAGCEAIGAASGWNEALYRTWYLTGAVWTAGWLGLGTIFLLARTRFGYAVALCLVLAGLFTLLTQQRYHYEGAGSTPVIYLAAAGLLAAGVAAATYLQSSQWALIAFVAVAGATLLSLVIGATVGLAAPGYVLDPVTGVPTADLFPGSLRLLTPWLNVTGGFSLLFGAIFSAYVFMPKRRVLAYSLDAGQKGDEFLFNLAISLVAFPVNFVASLPGAVRALAAGRLHSRVPSTILIAIGAFTASSGDTLQRFGVTDFFYLGKLLAVIFLFLGFLVSVEAFNEVRVPFTRIVLLHRRAEPAPAGDSRLGT
jgi:hypothetical protein